MNKVDCIHLGLPRTGTTFLQKEVFPKIKDVKILSDENFGGMLIAGHREALKRDLIVLGIRRKYGRKIKIILGIRNQDTWLRSNYNQYIMGGVAGVNSFNKWFNCDIDKGLLETDDFISLLKYNFDNVFIYRFEDFCNDKGKVIGDLCNFLGVEKIDYNDIVYRKSVNISLLKVMQSLNIVRTILRSLLEL